ncbi:MDR family MFS transporter [Dellaglioa sp. BT-FLS60]
MNSRTSVRLVTIAIFVATFLTAVEGTIVSTAMPTIVGELHGVSLMNWVFSIYLLTNAMMTPIYGKLADVLGRKPVFIFGLIIFLVGSTLCGFSNSMTALIISRAIQGIGAGAIMPVSFTILADIYSVEKRAKVMGLNGSAWGIASVVAPLLGGFIVDHLNWHWVFFINLPIGLITIVMIQLFFKEKRRIMSSKIDFLGSFLLMIGILSILYSFQRWGDVGIDLIVFIFFFLFVVTIFLFILWEKRVEDPIISLKLFKNRTFVIQNLVAALISGFLIGFEVYIPTWTQGILGLKASMAGFAVTPSSILWIAGSFFAGNMMAAWVPKKVLAISLFLVLIGAVALGILPIDTPFYLFFIISAVLGVGFGITITATTVTAQSLVPQADIGMATSFNTLSRTLGQTLMISVFGIIFNAQMHKEIVKTPGTKDSMMDILINPQTANQLPQHLIPKLREVLYQGLHGIYVAGICVVILAIIVNLFDKKTKDYLQ